jgi:hypothetical protein
MASKPGIVISVIVGGIVGLAAMRLLGLAGVIFTGISIFAGALAIGGIYHLMSGGGPNGTDKK